VDDLKKAVAPVSHCLKCMWRFDQVILFHFLFVTIAVHEFLKGKKIQEKQKVAKILMV
jgi:hypothetical protein